MRYLPQEVRRLLERIRLPVSMRATAQRQGGHRSPVLASGVEFADHRPYVPGDDVRRIDWRVFARNHQLVLRQFEEERDATVYVLLDLSGSMSRGEPPKIEMAKRLAASFAYAAMRQFDRAMIVPFGDALERTSAPLRHTDHTPELERFLADLSVGGETSLKAAVRTFRNHYPRRSLVVVISDLMSQRGFVEGLEELASVGHEVRVVHVRADEDEAPKMEGELELVDAETGELVRLRVSRELLAAYAREVRLHVQACRDTVRKRQGRFVDVPTDLPMEIAIRRAFAAQDPTSTLREASRQRAEGGR